MYRRSSPNMFWKKAGLLARVQPGVGARRAYSRGILLARNRRRAGIRTAVVIAVVMVAVALGVAIGRGVSIAIVLEFLSSGAAGALFDAVVSLAGSPLQDQRVECQGSPQPVVGESTLACLCARLTDLVGTCS